MEFVLPLNKESGDKWIKQIKNEVTKIKEKAFTKTMTPKKMSV